ncbi:unnamed protein product (macronuclear) [Paramecium tetraurelia]|uniref:STAS domain-containing protein n=1 Tax=Paramecium tetraurelia TaxID=5888 RepID=A0CH81_PARTE|nr:uncharacterized protein GSPATT00007588001 [Paramecium tetraurelia]CAK70148.1 unnamed protein product [Paramecium tetraurelia]|eukprot:XP_001437545.1 hypothetical protein (macronuclear) [Paramecium tetraurelia strain d4-2]
MSQQPLIEIPTLNQNENQQQGPNIKSSKLQKQSSLDHLSVHSFKSGLTYIRDSWKSGMAQTILNMPFHLTIGSSSGCNASVGITTAFIAALTNGFFSGSNHSIYMPSWVVIGLNYQLVKTYGVEVMPWITIIVGIYIYLAGLLKWHHLSDFIPVYVIEGFLLGIASLFFFSYSDYMFGLTDNHSNRGVELYSSYYDMFISFQERGDLYYFVGAWCVFLFLQMGRIFFRQFPWIFITTLTGLTLGIVYPTEKCLRSAYGQVTIYFNFIEYDGPKFHPDFQVVSHLLTQAIPITLFILIQNQFCARAGQSLSGVKCDYDQEIQCVSTANILSGIFGGLPCCASSRMYILDIKLRKTNQWSSILNALSILFFYGVFSKFFMDIPFYIISGQLLYMIINIPPWHYYVNLYRTQRKLILFYIFCIAWLCVNYGAIQSTLIGSMHALIIFAQKMSSPSAEVMTNQKEGVYQINLRDSNLHEFEEECNDIPPNLEGTYTVYRFNGALNYINIKGHIDQIKELAKTDVFILSFRYVCVFDFQAVDSLAIIIDNMRKNSTQVYITGLHPGMLELLSENKIFKEYFTNESHMFHHIEKLPSQ